MENFDTPYFSANPAEFWRRWHISLSSWLRDYLYISLGGSRTTQLRTLRNLLLTMLLGGLWHGAAWGFVLWGAFHGTWLVVHRVFCRERGSSFQVPRWLAILATFHLTCIGWILFRAQPTGAVSALVNAADYMSGLLSLSAATWVAPPLALVLVAIPLLSDLLQRRVGESFWTRDWHWMLRGMALGVLATAAAILSSEHPQTFVYFQF
jgi:D-alanyl-lipoteichoic acid acyltransferase DltB (MBOAT superfamily)